MGDKEMTSQKVTTRISQLQVTFLPPLNFMISEIHAREKTAATTNKLLHESSYLSTSILEII